jgi:hypothetical protein
VDRQSGLRDYFALSSQPHLLNNFETTQVPRVPRSRRVALSATPHNWCCTTYLFRILAVGLLFGVPCPLESSNKDKLQYGTGLIASLDMPESEVASIVEQIAQNGIIRGTKEYNKDQYISGATAETTTHAFPAWTGSGRVFYKVRKQAIVPRNFKDSSDVGTLAVRYLIQPTGDKTTVLRIDALFVEDYRHTVHPSNGSVEDSEYQDIMEHLEGPQLMKKETTAAEKRQADQVAGSRPAASVSIDAPPEVTASTVGFIKPHSHPSSPAVPERSPSQTLEEYVQDLRRQAERLVKSPGAPLKSAPFHMASTLRSLPAGTEVLIVISSSYWYGVETHDGQHGWMSRDQLESMP